MRSLSNRISGIVTSIWFLGSLLSVPIIMLMPNKFEKYSLNTDSVDPINIYIKNPTVYYYDLYKDGEKRQVVCGNFQTHNNSLRRVLSYSDDKPFVFLHGEGGNYRPEVFIGDMDKDDWTDILGFSFAGDSLYLNHFELGQDEIAGLTLMDKHFIEFPHGENLVWTRIKSGQFVDLDSDGRDEFLFALISHGTNTVRSCVYIFDYSTRTLKRSAQIENYYENLQCYDLDGDGYLEIIADGKSAVYKSNYDPLGSEVLAGLKILDHNLNVIARPIKDSKVETFSRVIFQDGEPYIYSLSNKSLNDYPESFLFKFNSEGKLVQTLRLDNMKRAVIPFFAETGTKKMLVYTEKGKVQRIDKNLNLKSELVLGKNFQEIIFSGHNDINEDGITEFFVSNYKTGIHYLFTDEFRTQIKITDSERFNSWIDLKVGENRFYTQNDKNAIIYSFKRNPYQVFRFPVYIIVYLFVVGLLYALRKVQESRIRAKYEIQSRIRDLQLLALKNQLDPHFVYNTFNTIGSIVRQGRNEEAYDIIVHFSQMVRNNLVGDSINTTLKEEMQFVKDYLYIQKYRFKERIHFNIDMQEGVYTSAIIPKLLIQIHVENALKHGLKNVEEGGVLSVRVGVEWNGIKVEISDNGVGRKNASMESSKGTGVGLKTLSEIIDNFNSKGIGRISQQVVDLIDSSGKPNGTKVIVNIRK